ncbi:MAG TPA: hypothetical protein ENJ29_14330 [Bacteroidetes bacterium]|nr:hypothetical protein [Bacteroidota bacterium]
MKILEKVLVVFWSLVILFGLVMVAGGLAMLADPDSERTLAETLVLILFIGGLPLALGVWRIVRIRQTAGMRAQAEMERRLLQLAQENGGRITVAEAALHLPISAEQARDLLDACHINGLADPGVSADGAVVYHFRMGKRVE